MYDGNPEPNMHKLSEVLISKSGGELCVLRSKTWRIRKFGNSLLKLLSLKDAKILVRVWFLIAKTSTLCCKRGLVKSLEKTFKKIMPDTTLHLLMVIKTLFKLEAGQFDIETAFLYGKLEEELWMDILEGYSKYLQENMVNR
jgi:hypothetical protein